MQRKRNHLQRYTLDGYLLLYRIDQFDGRRTVIANVMNLCTQIIHKYHDIPVGGHLGRKKTFAAVSRDFFLSICMNGCANGFARAKSANE